MVAAAAIVVRTVRRLTVYNIGDKNAAKYIQHSHSQTIKDSRHFQQQSTQT